MIDVLPAPRKPVKTVIGICEGGTRLDSESEEGIIYPSRADRVLPERLGDGGFDDCQDWIGIEGFV